MITFTRQELLLLQKSLAEYRKMLARSITNNEQLSYKYDASSPMRDHIVRTAAELEQADDNAYLLEDKIMEILLKY